MAKTVKNPRITKKEIAIIKRAKAGDKQAFNILFNKYKVFVEKLLYYYLKDMDESKDLANVVFLKVYNKLSTFTNYSSFGGWLRIITNRTALDYLRNIEKEALPMSYFSEDIKEESVNELAEDEMINHLTYKDIVSMFKNFSEPSCTVLELFYVDNMTVDAIAERTGLPTGTIKSILSRSRKKIKKQLKL